MKLCSATCFALLAVVLGVSAAPQPEPAELEANSLANATSTDLVDGPELLGGEAYWQDDIDFADFEDAHDEVEFDVDVESGDEHEHELQSRALSRNAKTYLALHNNARKKYHAKPLKWNAQLASMAKTWTKKCKFEHSKGKLRKASYGENLAAGTGSYKAKDGMKGWMSEAKDYNSKSPQYSHFTQVVWKGTKEVGCAWTKCPAGSIFDKKYGKAMYHACTYSPPGNVIGRFAQNVQV